MNDKRKTFGQRLRELRLARGYGQRELARIAGLAPSLVWQYENDLVEPRLFSAICLADALGVSLDYLVAGRGSADNIT